MNVPEFVLDGERQTGGIRKATVLVVEDDTTVLVEVDGSAAVEVRCHLLQTSEADRLELSRGDCVLVWSSAMFGEDSVVLGRVGPRTVGTARDAETVPDELVVEAKRALTFKCGEGSISLREDGRILIKGKDLVSHAMRMNRVKGGAVSIN